MSSNSPDHNAKGTRSGVPKNTLPLLVSTRFQDLFHSPPGVLFTFPSRYSFTIGHRGVFRLGGWSPQIHAELHVFRATRDTTRGRARTTTGLSPSLAGLSRPLRLGAVHPYEVVPQPRGCMHPRFGLVPVRSPLLGESLLISFPPGTEMFQFPGLAPLRVTGLNDPPGCPIRSSWDHSLRATPPGLSQLATTFIASRCQGIHRVPYCV